MERKEDQISEHTRSKIPKLETDRVTNMDKKREDCIGWDDYFMGIAFLSAQRSKDPGRSPWSLAVAVRPKS